MARMPGATWLPANDGNSRMRMARWDIVCIHTIVGFAPAPAAHFSTDHSGRIWQHRDTDFQSAANLNGNARVIAVENEDHGADYGQWSGSAVPRFAPAQAESIAQVLVWANRTHGVPLDLCPDSRPGSRGIAYHRQGIDGNFTGPYGGRVPGGEVWSSSRGKVCPGDARIKQLIEEIIPRAKALAGGESDDVSRADVDAALWAFLTGIKWPNLGNRNIVDGLAAAMSAAQDGADDEGKILTAVSDAKASALTAIAGISTGEGLTDAQVEHLADRLNALIGGSYHVTITRTEGTQ